MAKSHTDIVRYELSFCAYCSSKIDELSTNIGNNATNMSNGNLNISDLPPQSALKRSITKTATKCINAMRTFSEDGYSFFTILTQRKMPTETVVIIINIAKKTPKIRLIVFGKSIIKSPSQHHLRGVHSSHFSFFYKDFFFLLFRLDLNSIKSLSIHTHH